MSTKIDKKWEIIGNDKEILRELAKRKLEIANEPVMEERRMLWHKRTSLQNVRPMILLESGGVGNEFFSESELKCSEKWAREIESSLIKEIKHYEKVYDDSVVDPFITINWKVEISNLGVDLNIERGIDSQGRNLGYHWESPIKNLEKDLEKLHYRTLTIDRNETLDWKNHLEEIFNRILAVKIRRSFWWTMGFTQTAIFLLGLDKFMLYMYDDPENLHKLMKFLSEDNLQLAKGLEKEGVLSLNNNNDHIGSGSRGFTTELPQPDYKEENSVRLKNLWVLLESQETVGISPMMFDEFIINYYLPIAEHFGLVYYGCCEQVHEKWQSIKKIKNLRAVSISPWCDQLIMAEACGKNYIFSRKPSPALLSTNIFNEEAIRCDLKNTLTLTKKYNCNAELIMKDLHTVNNKPERMGRWVQIAREVIDEM